MKTPITKIQAPKKSQCPNPNSSGGVGTFELRRWSFSGVWSFVFDVFVDGFWCFARPSIVNHKS